MFFFKFFSFAMSQSFYICCVFINCETPILKVHKKWLEPSCPGTILAVFFEGG